MPAIRAFEGINLLTIYYSYRASEELSAVVLEVSTTFCNREKTKIRCHPNIFPILFPTPVSSGQLRLPMNVIPCHFFVLPSTTGRVLPRSHQPSIPLCDPPKPSIREHLRMPDHKFIKPAVGPLKLVTHLTP